MIKISPFTPLFFNPSTDEYGADSRYMQVFASTDTIVVEVVTSEAEVVSGRVVNVITDEAVDMHFDVLAVGKVSFYYARITGLAEGCYHADVCGQTSDLFRVVGESELEGTTLIQYTSTNNMMRSDTLFWNGSDQIVFDFRVHGGFKDDDWAFAVNNEQFEIANGNVIELFAVESTQKSFTMGTASGCPIWFGEHLNRILCCNNVHFNGTRYVRKASSVPEVVKGVGTQKSYVFKVQLQGMAENIDVELPGEGGESSGGGEGYVYLVKLNDSTRPTDANTFSALRTLLEINNAVDRALEDITSDKFLRKDVEDTANKQITFAEGLKTLGARLSMTSGSGTVIQNGLVQTDRLEVRDSMVVMDMIINELQGIASDFVFSDVGKVQAVEKIKMQPPTYKLYMEKRTDNDFTTLQENDILKQIVNTIPKGGIEYYSSWLRVLTTNMNDNSVTAVLYANNQVPGGTNYEPVNGFNIARRGNADSSKEDRSSWWELSSKEGRLQFLEHVNEPVLHDENISLSVGKLPDIEAMKNLPVIPNKDVGIVAQTIIAENFYQFDWNGDIRCNMVDRGEWSHETALNKPYRRIRHDRVYPDGKHQYVELEQHTVYHYGCKWGCLIDHTIEEPAWNSQGWALLEGDKSFTLDFQSSNGWQFFPRNMETQITAYIYHANRDVTDSVLQATPSIEWLRDTGNVAADNSWKPRYVGGKKNVIQLDRWDMGAGWMTEYRNVKFICRVAIPYGDTVEVKEKTINIKL